MATHSSNLAGRIPRTEEPRRLQSGVAKNRTWLKWLGMREHTWLNYLPTARLQHTLSSIKKVLIKLETPWRKSEKLETILSAKNFVQVFKPKWNFWPTQKKGDSIREAIYPQMFSNDHVHPWFINRNSKTSMFPPCPRDVGGDKV